MSQKIYTDLDINGNVKSNSYKFNLPSSVSSQPNMLIPKTDGTRPIWYDNSSGANDLAFKSDVDNLQIGGRNLFRMGMLGKIVGGVWSARTDNLNIEGNKITVVSNPNDVFATTFNVKGREITISGRTNIPIMRAFINPYNSAGVKGAEMTVTTQRDGENFLLTYTLPVDTVRVDLGLGFYPFSTYGTYWVDNVKVEQGNKATDWTPAPEDKQDRLQDITGNIGVGKTDASATEKLDVNGNVKATGFKTPSGTSTQFLMADGSVDTYGTTAGTVAEGNHTHTFTSITSKPTTLSGYGITDGIKLDDTIQNTNVFGGRKLYINTIDNVLAGANKKYWVTVTKHKKIYNSVNYPKAINVGDITLPQWEDSPIIATYDGNQLFNNNYEDNITCESDEYLKVALDFSADKTAYFNGYPYGTYYLSYYHTSTPDKAEVRCYNGFSTHTIGYKTGAFTDFINTNSSSAYVQQYTDDSNYQRRNIEFIIYGHPSHPTSLTQIEWKLRRPEFNKHSSFVSNFTTNKLYQTLKLGDQTTDKIILNPNGTITADVIGIGTTSPGARLDVVGLFDALPARILRHASYGEILRIGRNGVTETASINYPADGVFAINTASSERMRIDANGNVGIGTTSPNEKLTVSGKIYAYPRQPVVLSGQGSPYYGTNITLASDIGSTQGANRIWSRYDGTGSGATTFERSTNSQAYNSDPQLLTYTESMRIAGNGNVGIGTVSPVQKLHVEGSSYFGSDMFTNAEGGIFFSGNNTYTVGTYSRGNNLVLQAGGYERMRITSDGNVGIGTTTPSYKLDVDGIINVNATPGSYGTLIRLRDTVSSGTESFGGVHFTSSPGTDYTIGKWSTAAGAGLLQIRDQSGNAFMTINGVGNVGIGTTSPSEKLDVNGGVRITGDLIGNVSNINLPSGTSYGVFYASQTIGGVNAFSYKSKDDSDQNSYGRAVIYACPQDGVVLYSNNLLGTNESRISLDHGNTYIRGTNFVGISTGSGGYKLYINSAGNVGIGTTSPSEKLTVSGTIENPIDNSAIIIGNDRNLGFVKKSGYQAQITTNSSQPIIFSKLSTYAITSANVASGTLTELMRITNSGDVGIGTNTPTATLEVSSSNYTGIAISRSIQNAGVYIQAKGYDTGNIYRVSSQITFDQVSDTFWVNGGISFATASSGSLVTRWKILTDGTFQSNGAGKIETSSSNLTLNAPFGDIYLMPQSTKNVGIGTTTPSEKLEVNGNIKSIDIIDQQGISIYLKLKTVNGNVTLDNSYHNKIVRITASCTITIPNNLRTDFNCTFEVIGAYTAQFVDGSGATTSAPFGRYLKTDLTAMFYCTGTASNYRLNGSLATS